MPIVRESPRAKVSPDRLTTQWPPKSPFQALLSSPSGRRKWQDYHAARERSVSPSPRKPGAMTNHKALRQLSQPEDEGQGGDVDMDDDGDGSEDEEMLQAKMEALKARLRVKQLQKAKKLAGRTDEGGVRSSSRADLGRARSMSPSKSALQHEPRDVQVQLSPVKDRITPQEQMSPARKRLGLHTAARAQDVSLKRPRDATNAVRAGGLDQAAPRPSSFSARLTASKADAEDHRERQDRMLKSRSRGFGEVASAVPRTRQERPRSAGRVAGESIRASQLSLTTPATQHDSVPPTRSIEERLSRASGIRSSAKPSRHKDALPGATDSESDLSVAPKGPDVASDSHYDPFSELHLSKRHIPHSDIARAMSEKEIYTLPRLLKEVVSPHYDPPDCEDDFVVFAVLASKSSPFDQKAAHRTSDENAPQEDANAPRNKFMVLKLTDLKWEIDCFLFGTAFDQFWKLTPGTLLAILNPSILPPKTNVHNGRFSLKLGSSEDSVMEIGIARDLAYCSSVKKDGQQCGDWIDKRSAEICEFHLNLFIEKQRKGRMEVNTMWRGTGNDPDSHIKSRSRAEGGFDKQLKSGKNKNITQSREYGTLYSVPSSYGPSTANLLDAEDTDILHNMTTEEASRKRLAAAQRERDLQRQLASMGRGVGAEYMRSMIGTPALGSEASAAEAKRLFEKPKAADLGLLNNKAGDVRLEPAKDRKKHFGLGAVSRAGGRDVMGWSGATKPGMLREPAVSKAAERLASPERGQQKLDTPAVSRPVRAGIVRERSQEGSLSPKKRARFNLENKGIREPGRESLGKELLAKGADSDDDLDIVHL